MNHENEYLEQREQVITIPVGLFDAAGSAVAMDAYFRFHRPVEIVEVESYCDKDPGADLEVVLSNHTNSTTIASLVHATSGFSAPSRQVDNVVNSGLSNRFVDSDETCKIDLDATSLTAACLVTVVVKYVINNPRR